MTRKPATNQADTQQQSPNGSAISIIEEPEDDIDNDSEDEINYKYRSIWSMKEMAGVFDITPIVKTVMEVLEDRQRGVNLDVEEVYLTGKEYKIILPSQQNKLFL